MDSCSNISTNYPVDRMVRMMKKTLMQVKKMMSAAMKQVAMREAWLAVGRNQGRTNGNIKMAQTLLSSTTVLKNFSSAV